MAAITTTPDSYTTIENSPLYITAANGLLANDAGAMVVVGASSAGRSKTLNKLVIPQVSIDISGVVSGNITSCTVANASLTGIANNEAGSKAVAAYTITVKGSSTSSDGHTYKASLIIYADGSEVLTNVGSSTLSAFNALATGDNLKITVSYQVSDGGVTPSYALASETIQINGANNPPIALDDIKTIINENAGFNITAASTDTKNVLFNDKDIDGSHNKLILAAASDANTSTTVNGLNLNPVILDFSGVVNGKLAATDVIITNVLLPAGAVAAYQLNINGHMAFLTLNADGSEIFTNSNGALNGLAKGDVLKINVAYQVSDQQGGFATATQSLTINGVNDGPVATADTFSTSTNATLIIDAAQGVLTNDSDLDSPVITAALRTTSTRGTLIMNSNGDGGFNYTANAGYYGTDTFTYRANDGMANSATVKATIQINPIANNDSYSLDENSILTISTKAAGILGNDTASLSANALKVVLDLGPTNGSLNLNLTTGTFIYTPTTGTYGTDSFTYHLVDTKGLVVSNTTTVSLTINDVAPTVAPDSYSVNENGVLSVDGINAPTLLANDSSPNPLSTVAETVATAQGGSAAINTDGTFVYTPATGFFGQDSFTYHATDGTLSSPGIATITINEAIVNQMYNSNEGMSNQTYDLGALYADPYGGTITYSLINAPSGLTIDGNGHLVFGVFPANHAIDLNGTIVHAVDSQGGNLVSTDLTGYVFDSNTFNIFVDGTPENDTLTTQLDFWGLLGNTAGRELIRGGDGNDTIIADPSYAPNSVYGTIIHTFDGGSGNNTIDYSSYSAANPGQLTINLETGTMEVGGTVRDALINIQNIINGGPYGGYITGNSQDNIIDIGNPDSGYTTIVDGGGGNDTLSFAHLNTGASYYISSDGQDLGGGKYFSSASIENVNGSNFNDNLAGDSNNNIITGGLGNDTLAGGGGADTFVFNLLQNEGADILLDFNPTNFLKFSGVNSLAQLDASIANFTNNSGHLQVQFTNGASVDFNTVNYASIANPSLHQMEDVLPANHIIFG